MNTAPSINLRRALLTAALTTLAVPAARAETSDAAAIEADLVSTATSAESPAPRPVRRHGRMALETAAVLAVGTSWYWRDNGKANEVDWQLPWDARALGAKVGMGSDGWRFDGNAFEINALCHPGFGALMHALARNNGYSLAESFLISTAASGAWELFVEWAEYGGINDLFSTSTTGVPVGEAAYQLWKNRKHAHVALTTGAGSEAGDPIAMVGASAALNTLPSEGEGRVSPGRKVSVGLEIPFDGDVRAIEAGAKASLWGYHHAKPGLAVFAGASAEFYFRDRKDRPHRDGDLVSFTAAGPTLDVTLERSGITIDVGADLYAEFAMLKSQAFAAWRAANPMERVRNSMQDKARPYYYGWGVTVDPRLHVQYRGVHAGGKLAASRFASIEGHDRDQEMLTADPHMFDLDTFAQAWAGYTTERFGIAVDGRIRRRSGEAGTATGEASDRTTMLTVSYRH